MRIEAVLDFQIEEQEARLVCSKHEIQASNQQQDQPIGELQKEDVVAAVEIILFPYNLLPCCKGFGSQDGGKNPKRRIFLAELCELHERQGVLQLAHEDEGLVQTQHCAIKATACETDLVFQDQH